jgi:hypothetical protein
MASEIYYMPASQTLDAAAIDNGRVVEKFTVTGGTTVTVFGPAVKTWVTNAWANQTAGTAFTLAAGQTVEGPFTKIQTGASTTVVAYLK